MYHHAQSALCNAFWRLVSTIRSMLCAHTGMHIHPAGWEYLLPEMDTEAAEANRAYWAAAKATAVGQGSSGIPSDY